MPNYVYNRLKFTCHGETTVAQIKAFLGDDESPISFKKLIPQPDGIQDPNPAVLSDEEYEWCRKNWGTKWGAMDVQITHEADWKIGFTFQTAWNIPAPIIDLIFKSLPGCNIEYVAADDGGWIGYHKTQNDQGEVSISDFAKMPQVKAALFSALNTEY